MKRLIVALLSLALMGAVAATPGPMPDQIVRTNLTKILAQIKTHRAAYEKNYPELRRLVGKYALPYFDFQTMARLVLARYWRTATAPQRQRFTDEFRELLVRTYSTALLRYNREQIDYLPFAGRPGDRTATVRTRIKEPGSGQTFPIDYSFFQTAGGWKVYDVSIDGVSLVMNYRSTYAEQIGRKGLDNVIADMARSNAHGDTAPAITPGAAARAKSGG